LLSNRGSKLEDDKLKLIVEEIDSKIQETIEERDSLSE
jgi:hypothetical protein